ncbi:MAG: SRPBCC family protein [Bdellovibrionota bacterium]
MIRKIALSVSGVLVVFLLYVSTRESKFDYSVTRQMKAPVETVFPYLSQIRLGSEWSPFEKADPNMKKDYDGNRLMFEGNREVGAGSVEITKVVPNQQVDLILKMTEPFKAENQIYYTVKPVDGGTQFTWRMTGDGGFIMKLMSIFMDCEKMITDQFNKGMDNLQQIVEK